MEDYKKAVELLLPLAEKLLDLRQGVLDSAINNQRRQKDIIRLQKSRDIALEAVRFAQAVIAK